MSDQHEGRNLQRAAVLVPPPDPWMFRYRCRTRPRVSRIPSHDSLVSTKSDDSTTSCVPDTSISVRRLGRAGISASHGRRTVSYRNLREFLQTMAVRKIAEKVMSNKRLGTKANSGNISALYLYCTFARARIAESHPAAPAQMLILLPCIL